MDSYRGGCCSHSAVGPGAASRSSSGAGGSSGLDCPPGGRADWSALSPAHPDRAAGLEVPGGADGQVDGFDAGGSGVLLVMSYRSLCWSPSPPAGGRGRW